MKMIATSAKLTNEQKMVLDYLAAQHRTTISELIRKAIVDRYDLDRATLQKEASSFFASAVRDVKHHTIGEIHAEGR